jgi:tetratricopeptide (TPR) repeat protein/predicted Ser/Thr protein kinase
MSVRCPLCEAENSETSHFCSECGAQLAGLAGNDLSRTMTLQPERRTLKAGETVAGKYEILGDLGRGGMGEVYLAKDTTLSRQVALKFLPDEMNRDEKARRRFGYEARAAASLDHPYICSIHEVGESEGRLFFAMEYVDGLTLRQRIAAGPVSAREALAIAEEVAEALQRAHDRGLVHRDLKPANVMLMNSGHVKVMDFGLAKPVFGGREISPGEASLTGWTESGISPGTPAYMSPEQLRGMPLDPRTDIFSFGVLLYEMLTGVHPFKKQNGVTTVAAILSEDPPPISGPIADLPENLQKMIAKMLAKDPARRYQSMSAVHAELKAMRQGFTPQPRASFLARPARRALAAVAVVALVAGAFWMAKVLFLSSAARALAFQERDWILITDFENTTGEKIFDGSLETALAVGIQQSQYVNVFPRNRVQETLKRMRRDDVQRVDESIGREIALREGIKGLLACQISKIGDRYLLTGKIVDPNTQTAVFSYAAPAKNQDEVLRALDDLASRVRRGLGESLARISRQKLSLPRATTTSLEALKCYSDAKLASGTTAFGLLEQAITLDPEFAMAHAELGMKYYIDGDRAKGEEHFQRALGLLDRLTTREQLLIRALVEDWRGNREQGIENYKAYLVQYPDDPGAWYRLGYALMVLSRVQPALEAFEKVVALDSSSSGAYINMATCYQNLGRKEEALENYERAFRLKPEEATGIFVNNEYGFLLVKMGRIEEARRTFETMIQQGEAGKKARGYRSLGLLDMYLGKYAEAQSAFRESAVLNRALKAGLSELRDHLFLASIFSQKNQGASFDKEMARVLEIQEQVKIEPYFLYLVGRALAREGRIGEARAQLADLEARLGDLMAVSGVNRSNRGDQASLARLKGEVAVAERVFDEAIDSFSLAARLGANQAEEELAYAAMKKGDVEKAIGFYREFLKSEPFGYEAQESWVLAHYELGKLCEQLGQRTAARQYYESFLEIWKDGDPDLPALAEAKKRLEALAGS